MDLQNIVSALTLLGRETEQRVVVDKIKQLSQGQGGVLLVTGKSQYGQKNIIRNMVKNSGIPYYLGYGSSIPVPYDVFRHSFTDVLSSFTTAHDNNLKNVNKLEKSIYRGFVGKATRRFAKSTQPLEKRTTLDLHMSMCRHVMSSELPAIFYCEDLEWAEASSFDLLYFLIKSLSVVNTPVLFILQMDLESQKSITPFSVRNKNVSVMEKLHAMKMSTKRRTGTRPKDFIAKLQEMETTKLEMNPISDKEVEKVLKKILGTKLLSSSFIGILKHLTEGSGLFLGDILLYLSKNVLEFRSQKWHLKYPEEDIQLFNDVDLFMHSNIEDLGEDIFNELQRASFLAYPIRKNIWKESSTLSGEAFEECLQIAISNGIIFAVEESSYVFHSDFSKRALIASCSEKEKTHCCTNIANSLNKSHAPYLHLYYWKNSDKPEMSLEYILQAGIENEKMMAYENAYFLYEEGAKIFPEILEMFDEVANDMLKKSKEKNADLLEPLLTLFKLYRIAGLLNKEGPLLTPEVMTLWKKIIYDYSPDKVFPEFAWLLLFLLKSNKASVKTYDKTEVETLALILIKELCPGKDHQTRSLFFEALINFSNDDEQRNRLAVNYEKWAVQIGKEEDSNPLSIALKYLLGYEVYNTFNDHFNCARTLHLTIKLCKENINTHPFLPLLEIEALRLLGLNYQKQCYKQRKKEQEANDPYAPKKHINYALQATAAYIDSARLDIERRACPWLSIYNLEKAYKFCQEIYIEDELVSETLRRAQNEWEHLLENDTSEKSAFIISHPNDAGAASIIAEAATKEQVTPEIDIECINDTEKVLEKMSKHSISFLVMQPNSQFSFSKTEDIHHIMASYQKEQKSGWFVREYGEHTQFIIWEETSPELVITCLRFLEENILRSYV